MVILGFGFIIGYIYLAIELNSTDPRQTAVSQKAKETLDNFKEVNKADKKIEAKDSSEEKNNSFLARVETGSLSDQEVIDELEKLKTYVYESDLIDRLNRGLSSKEEQKNAQRIFERIILLGAVKAERKLAQLTPELEKAIAKQEEKLAHIKDVLN